MTNLTLYTKWRVPQPLLCSQSLKYGMITLVNRACIATCILDMQVQLTCHLEDAVVFCSKCWEWGWCPSYSCQRYSGGGGNCCSWTYPLEQQIDGGSPENNTALQAQMCHISPRHASVWNDYESYSKCSHLFSSYNGTCRLEVTGQGLC